jgi:hypothetical protein
VVLKVAALGGQEVVMEFRLLRSVLKNYATTKVTV